MSFAKINFFRPGRAGRIVCTLGLAIALAGCEDGAGFNLFEKKPAEGGAAADVDASGGGRTVERDVESPEVFQVTDAGLWDGRPSLGGVWVAHPDVKEPERVIIRNIENEKFVVGALFRRERENPGPRLQVSSDAAEALGMLAGQPLQLNVTALRREEVAQQPDVEGPASIDEPETVETTALDPVAGEAAAAIEAAENAQPAKPAPKPTPKASGLEKPFIQIGIFSIERNAENTAVAMRQSGMVPTVKEQQLKGKTFWRVLVGPATNSSERAALLKKIKAAGYTDAYFVSN